MQELQSFMWKEKLYSAGTKSLYLNESEEVFTSLFSVAEQRVVVTTHALHEVCYLLQSARLAFVSNSWFSGVYSSTPPCLTTAEWSTEVK